MKHLAQQDLLLKLKEVMGATWDDVALRTRIKPRTLKSYRLPDGSKGARGMDIFVRNAVEAALLEEQNKGKKRA